MLPEGTWTIRTFDLISMTETVVSENATGNTGIRIPESRAFMVHLKKNNQ